MPQMQYGSYDSITFSAVPAICSHRQFIVSSLEEDVDIPMRRPYFEIVRTRILSSLMDFIVTLADPDIELCFRIRICHCLLSFNYMLFIKT